MSHTFPGAYRPALIVALLLLTNSLFDTWHHAASSPATDFFILWGVPRALSIKPVQNIYTDEGQHELTSALVADASSRDASEKQRRATTGALQISHGQLDAPGSPLLYAVSGLLSTGEYEVDQQHFMMLCLLCSISSIVILSRLLGFSGVSTILLVILLTSHYAPFVSDVTVGNVNQVQLFIITLFIYFTVHSKRVLAGFALGIGMMLKPTVVTILILSMLVTVIDRDYRRQWHLWVGAAAATFISAVIASAYFGTSAVWVGFARNLTHTLSATYPLDDGNLGLSMLVADLTGHQISLFLLSAFVVGFVSIVVITRARTAGIRVPGELLAIDGQHELHEAFGIVSVGCAVMILSSKLAWLHYYVLLIPMSLYLIRPISGDEDATTGQVVRRLVAVITLLMLSTVTGELVQDNLRYSIVINTAAGLMLVLTVYEIWRHREALAAGSRSRRSRPTIVAAAHRRRIR